MFRSTSTTTQRAVCIGKRLLHPWFMQQLLLDELKLYDKEGANLPNNHVESIAYFTLTWELWM
jgi:hypothetical protein